MVGNRIHPPLRARRLLLLLWLAHDNSFSSSGDKSPLVSVSEPTTHNHATQAPG